MQLGRWSWWLAAMALAAAWWPQLATLPACTAGTLWCWALLAVALATWQPQLAPPCPCTLAPPCSCPPLTPPAWALPMLWCSLLAPLAPCTLAAACCCAAPATWRPAASTQCPWAMAPACWAAAGRWQPSPPTLPPPSLLGCPCWPLPLAAAACSPSQQLPLACSLLALACPWAAALGPPTSSLEAMPCCRGWRACPLLLATPCTPQPQRASLPAPLASCPCTPPQPWPWPPPSPPPSMLALAPWSLPAQLGTPPSLAAPTCCWLPWAATCWPLALCSPACRAGPAWRWRPLQGA